MQGQSTLHSQMPRFDIITVNLFSLTHTGWLEKECLEHYISLWISLGLINTPAWWEITQPRVKCLQPEECFLHVVLHLVFHKRVGAELIYNLTSVTFRSSDITPGTQWHSCLSMSITKGYNQAPNVPCDEHWRLHKSNVPVYFWITVNTANAEPAGYWPQAYCIIFDMQNYLNTANY